MSAYEPGDTMVEALRRANPVPAEQTAGRRSLPSAHALFADVVAQRPRRVRRRLLVIAIAIVVIAALLAAFAFVRREKASLPLLTSCYAAADLDARVIVVASGADPAQGCARFWTDGSFGRGAVPNFDVCVLPSGAPGVFPGDSGSVCARLALPAVSGFDNSVNRFADSVNRRVTRTCVGADEAEAIIKSELARFDLTNWTIKRGTTPFDSFNHCASLYTEVERRTITIVAQPSPYEPLPSSEP